MKYYEANIENKSQNIKQINTKSYIVIISYYYLICDHFFISISQASLQICVIHLFMRMCFYTQKLDFDDVNLSLKSRQGAQSPFLTSHLCYCTARQRGQVIKYAKRPLRRKCCLIQRVVCPRCDEKEKGGMFTCDFSCLCLCSGALGELTATPVCA